MTKLDQYNSRKIARLSFVAAMLVVAIHNTYRINDFDALPSAFAWAQLAVHYGVTRVAVPFFFIVSGYFLFRDYDTSIAWWGGKLKKRAVTLGLPYLTWIVLGALEIALINAVKAHPQEFFFWDDWSWWLEAVGITGGPLAMSNFWFVRILIMAVLIAPVLGFATKTLGAVAVWSVFAFGVFLSGGLLNWFFVVLGAWIAIKGVPRLMQRSVKSRWCCVAIGVVWAALVAIRTYLAAKGTSLDKWVESPLVATMNIAGVAFMWLIYDKFNMDKVMGWLDPVLKSAFFLYAAHPIVALARDCLLKPALYDQYSFAYVLTVLYGAYFAMVVIPVFVWWMLKRHAPKVVRLCLFGDR